MLSNLKLSKDVNEILAVSDVTLQGLSFKKYIYETTIVSTQNDKKALFLFKKFLGWI